jgi:hypothetical protein
MTKNKMINQNEEADDLELTLAPIKAFAGTYAALVNAVADHGEQLEQRRQQLESQMDDDKLIQLLTGGELDQGTVKLQAEIQSLTRAHAAASRRVASMAPTAEAHISTLSRLVDNLVEQNRAAAMALIWQAVTPELCQTFDEGRLRAIAADSKPVKAAGQLAEHYRVPTLSHVWGAGDELVLVSKPIEVLMVLRASITAVDKLAAFRPDDETTWLKFRAYTRPAPKPAPLSVLEELMQAQAVAGKRFLGKLRSMVGQDT